jgi:hypothetical protein
MIGFGREAGVVIREACGALFELVFPELFFAEVLGAEAWAGFTGCIFFVGFCAFFAI